MADELARAQAIGEIVQKPRCYWSKDATGPMAGVHSVGVPIYLVQVVSTLKDITIALEGGYSDGDPASAEIYVYHTRGANLQNMFSSSFQAGWANAVTSIGSPGWVLQPGDVLTVRYAQTAPGVSVPSTIVALTTEPS